MNGAEQPPAAVTDPDAVDDYLWSAAQRVDLGALDGYAAEAKRDEELIRGLLVRAASEPRQADPPPALPEATSGFRAWAKGAGPKAGLWLVCVTMVLLENVVLLGVVTNLRAGREGQPTPASAAPPETPSNGGIAAPAPNERHKQPDPPARRDTEVGVLTRPPLGDQMLDNFAAVIPLPARIDAWAGYWSSFPRHSATASQLAVDGWARKLSDSPGERVRWSVEVEAVSGGGVQLRPARCSHDSARALGHVGLLGGVASVAFPDPEVLTVRLSHREFQTVGSNQVAVSTSRFPLNGSPQELAALRPGARLDLYGTIEEVELNPAPGGGDPSAIRPCGIVLSRAYVKPVH